MNKELEVIIKASQFREIPGTWVYTKVRTRPNDTHFLVTSDSDEITVVTTADRVHELDFVERNKDDWTLIALEVSIPFYSVGFLAAVTKAIADKGMNILVVSTFSKDYILVRNDQTKLAREVLLELGFQEHK